MAATIIQLRDRACFSGEAFYLANWLRPCAAWLARGILAGGFKPSRCHEILRQNADAFAKRAKFERPGYEYIDSDEILLEELGRVEAKAEAVRIEIREEVTPMIRTGATKNAILATAHEVNSLRGFLLREIDIEPLVTAILCGILDPDGRRGWRQRRAG